MTEHRGRIGLFCGIVLITLASPAGATLMSWNDNTGGLASDSANWNPIQMPAGTDDLVFNLGGIYTITWNNSVTASNTHTYRIGTITDVMSSAHTVAAGITIGDLSGDNATLTLTTGTLNSNGNVVIGDAGGSTGTLNVNDDDADFIVANGADMTVGNNGDANLNITGSGRVQVADQFIAGANAASSPTILVSGFTTVPPGASVLDVLGTGESRVGQGGDATMTIQSGALASFDGDLIIANGSASTSSITVQTQGLFNARLNVSGDLLIGRNSSGTAAGVGTLNLNTGGEALIDGTTFLGDPNGGTGTINLNGGIFTGPGPISVLAGSLINGTGTIVSDITNNGQITPTGVNGITINGILSNNTNGINGTKIHFGAGGGYSGAGTCHAAITGDAASTITATGTLDIGTNTTAGFSYNGTMDVGGQIVTLVDSNGAVLGGLTTINSGRIECPAGIGVQNGATIQGDGLFVGDVTDSGVLDPHTAGNLGGLFTVQGDLLINPTGIVDIEIGGAPGSSNNDKINVSGTATFGGTLRVKLKNGYVPHVGEQFIAVNAVNGRIGEFVTILPPNPSPCNNVTFVDVYSSTAAIILVRPPLGCTALGDLNSDGSCNGKDVQLFVNDVLNAAYDSCADMNGDCHDDAGDVAIFVNCLI